MVEPRKPSSQKWTSLPQELLNQIQEVFTGNFAGEIDNGEILVVGRVYPEELLISVGYQQPDKLSQPNFEVSIDFDSQKQNALETIYLLVDCAGSLLSQYFEVRHLDDFPRIWEATSFSGRELFIQVTTVNARLEAEANRLLGISEPDALVKGDTEGDESGSH